MRLFSTGPCLALALFFPGALARAQAPASDQRSLTDRQMEKVGERDIVAMRGVLGAVDKLAAEARNEKDVIRLQCVNERKTQISGLLKVAELSIEDMRAAIKDREEEAVEHEFDKIGLAKSKVLSFKIEAQQCIGSLAFYDSNKTKVEVTVPADLPQEDTISPQPVESTFFRPPPASPLR